MLGTLRFALAIMVVVSHTRGYRFDHLPDPGIIAVVTFFFISGYLMPATFEANYRSDSFLDQSMRYLLNRFLRVYPIYWVVLGAALLILPNLPEWRDAYRFDVRSIIQNVVLLGLNQSDFWHSDTRYIGPAWTLDVELQFYVLVPLLVWVFRRRPRLIFAMLAVAAATSTALLITPTGRLSIDRSILPWSFFFAAGFATYYFRARAVLLANRYLLGVAGMVLATGTTLAFFLSPAAPTVVIIGALLIGSTYFLLYEEHKSAGCDHALGELSYPVFISHSVVIQTGVPAWLATYISLPPLFSLALASILLSVPVGYALSILVNPAVDRFRWAVRSHPPNALKLTADPPPQ